MQKDRHTFFYQLLKKRLKLEIVAKLMGISLLTSQQAYKFFMSAVNLPKDIKRFLPIFMSSSC